MKSKPIIAILTGAGISAESGLPTFRDVNGLWKNYDISEIARYKAFQKNPDLVHSFYNARRKHLLEANVKPNLAHLAIAEFQRLDLGDVHIFTQNVDDLHGRAGSTQVYHLHGELFKARCVNCQVKFPCYDDLTLESRTQLQCCSKNSRLRPDVVWFGEDVQHLSMAKKILKKCDIFVSIGTSGEVMPASQFVLWVSQKCKTIEINTQMTLISDLFQDVLLGQASEVVPQYFDSLKKSILDKKN